MRTIAVTEENIARQARGRPPEYDPSFCVQAFKYALLGAATDEDLARYFEVTPLTILKWKKEQPNFIKAIEDGKDRADANVADRLYERAMGYEHKETHVSQYKGEIIKTELVKRYPPDTAALSLWLRNRQSARWRDRMEYEPPPPGEAARLLRELIQAMDSATTEKKDGGKS